MLNAMLFLVSLPVGVWLLRLGRWPRRVGQSPHCPNCGYNLSGIVSDQCPECGGRIWPGNYVMGERRRRNAVALLGVVVILCPMGFWALNLNGVIQKIDWYRYRPTTWVIGDLDLVATGDRDKAWAELQRRLADGHVPAAQQDRIVERALVEQAGSGPGYMGAMVDFLGARCAAHRLSQPQSDRFFANALKLQLRVRPIVGLGDPVPYTIATVGRGPSVGWSTNEEEVGCWVDDRKLAHGSSRTSSGFSGWSGGGSLDPQPTGKHRLRLRLEYGAAAGTMTSSDAPMEHKKIIDATADFEVTAEPTVIIQQSAPSAETVRAALSATEFRCRSDDYLPLTGSIGAINPPVDLAFDVFVLADGKEYPCGSVSFRQSTNGGFGYSVGSSSPLPAGTLKADVILRSSPAAARRTIDMTSIWQGTVVFKDVPIAQVTPPSQR